TRKAPRRPAGRKSNVCGLPTLCSQLGANRRTVWSGWIKLIRLRAKCERVEQYETTVLRLGSVLAQAVASSCHQRRCAYMGARRSGGKLRRPARQILHVQYRLGGRDKFQQ